MSFKNKHHLFHNLFLRNTATMDIYLSIYINIYIYFRKHVYIVYFLCTCFGEEKKDIIYSLYRFDFILVLKCLLICCVSFQFLLENLFARIESPTAALFRPIYIASPLRSLIGWLYIVLTLRSIIFRDGLQNVIL